MSEHPIEGMMDTTLEKIKQMVDANTVIGEPVVSPDGSVVIPVSRIPPNRLLTIPFLEEARGLVVRLIPWLLLRSTMETSGCCRLIPVPLLWIGLSIWSQMWWKR